ncbi:MAG: glycosyltransferase [Rikenellaceae bacterium]
MKILSVGTFKSLSNTALHRHWALCKIAESVDVVDTSSTKTSLWHRVVHRLFLWGLPVPIPRRDDENSKICKLVDNNDYDVVWIDKGITITPRTLSYIKSKNPRTQIVSYSPDNMSLRHNQSQQYLDSVAMYDFHFTTKSYILDAMAALGAKEIYFMAKCYEPTFHFPRPLEMSDYDRLGCDVGFVGMWERERCESVIYLARHGVKVRVFGNSKWLAYRNVSENLTIEDHGLYSEDYSKSFRAFKISLCFLRKINRDQQTSRTMEIPASGGFMLAERTDEHMQLFEEGVEAEFFSSNEELLQKCNYYLSHEHERAAIVKNGLLRCKRSDYSNEGMIRRALQIVCDDKK